MANVNITQLPSVPTMKGTDEFPIGRDGTTTNKVTYDTLSGAIKNDIGTGTGTGTTVVNNTYTNTYTTVGNASAGIFASAVCFITGNGTWTAPDGCYTARVTVVGGGAGTTANGGRSHFNCPTGSSAGLNELFANGGVLEVGSGTNRGVGGSAGWNTKFVAGGLANDAGGGGVGGGGGSGGIAGNGKDGQSTGFGTNRGLGGKGASGGGGYGGGGGGGGGSNGGGGSYGRSGRNGQNSTTTSGVGGEGGGSPMLSYPATLLSAFNNAISQSSSPGMGVEGGGGGWCSAIISVTPGNSYPWAVGAGGAVVTVGGVTPPPAGNGMVVIEW